MRCKTCDYRLWNLTARTCPECGEPFQPSEFEFVINSVRFLCPHCGQDYYGTGPKGHLYPHEFDCVNCGRHIHMNQMTLLPTQDVAEEQTQVDRNPWLIRKEYGVIKAWFAMIGRGMIGPAKLMRATPSNSLPGSAIWFACASIILFSLIGFGPFILFPLMIVTGAGAGPAMTGFAIFAATPTVGVILFMLLWGVVAHVLLILTGSTEGGLGRTYQALGFSSGAYVISAVPCVGIYTAPIGWVWWVVSAVLMLQEGHKVSGRRAAFAGLTLPVLVLLSGIGLAVWGVSRGLTAARTAAAQTIPMVQGSVADISQAVIDHAMANQGRGPDHAARLLITGGALTADDFILPVSVTDSTVINVGNLRLSELDFADPGKQGRAVSAAAAALPDDVVAHRLGDMVFTYHGIDLTNPDPGLWLVIANPEPTANANMPAMMFTNQPTTIGLADGTTRNIVPTSFAADLAAQNQLRATLGLPPLPDPSAVTHAQPAVAAAP